MNVTLCSAFRNASSYLNEYIWREFRLRMALTERGDSLSLILAEGDSVDDTAEALLDEYANVAGVLLVKCDHGGPDYGPVVNADRFANLAKVWNAIWQRIPQDADAVIFVESDLIWEPSTLLALLDDLWYAPCVVPLVLLRRDGWPEGYWYDSWAYWRRGEQVRVMPPYFDGMDDDTDLLELDSAGSCLVMRGDVARGLVWPAEDVVVGICRQIRERGGSVWLDARQRVIHE